MFSMESAIVYLQKQARQSSTKLLDRVNFLPNKNSMLSIKNYALPPILIMLKINMQDFTQAWKTNKRMI
jgi:hypothetical protein